MKKLVLTLWLIFCCVASAHARSLLLDAKWLHTADIKDIQTQIQIGSDLNATDEHGRTPLIYALVFEKSAEIVQMLIKNGAKVNKESDDGNSPLIYALSIGSDSKIITLLLQNGADINATDKYGQPPLIVAIKNNASLQILQKLIKLGADINAEYTDSPVTENDEPHRSTPLLTAIRHKSAPEMIAFLLQNEADVNYRDSNGATPLTEALLLKSDTPIIELLIQYGADVNLADKEGITPLMSSFAHPNKNLSMMLIEKGAEITQNATRDKPLLIYALQQNAAPQVIEYLIEHGADVNLANNEQTTPLMIAAAVGNADTAEVLIKLGADINATDNHKNNALAYACRSNTNIRIIDLLLKYGANVNIQDTLDGTSPLMKAIRAKASPQVIAALLEAGADTTIYDRNHKSVLQQAKEYHPQIVELLLQHGAN